MKMMALSKERERRGGQTRRDIHFVVVFRYYSAQYLLLDRQLERVFIGVETLQILYKLQTLGFFREYRTIINHENMTFAYNLSIVSNNRHSFFFRALHLDGCYTTSCNPYKFPNAHFLPFSRCTACL